MGKLYHRLFREHAKGDKWKGLIEDNSEVKIETNPQGAAVWLFQYRYQDELNEIWPDAPWIAKASDRRLVACPRQDEAPALMPGRAVLEVLDDHRPFMAGDLIYAIDGEDYEVASSANVTEGQLTAVIRGAKRIELKVDAPFKGRCTLSSPFATRQCMVGFTPLAKLKLNTGWYLAVIEKKDWDRALYSFHVDYHADPYHRPGHADGVVFLQPKGGHHRQFIRVTAEAYKSETERPFEMMRTEVTAGDYLEFLNDVTRQDPDLVGTEGSGHSLVPRRSDGKAQWQRFGADGFQLPPETLSDHPVSGVSWHDALAYAKWFARRPGNAGWDYDLPTKIEWRRCGFGGDARRFVFGDHFRAPWVRGRFTKPVATMEVVGNRPHDENVYGHRDLCGSVAEWGRPPKSRETRYAPLYGGSWNDGPKSFFRIDAQRRVAVERTAAWIGFRLVRRPQGR